MITVYSSVKSSRLEYVLHFIFENLLEIEFKWTQDSINLDGVILNYSDQILPCQNYQIQPSGFLVDGNWDFKKYIFLKNKSNYFFPQEAFLVYILIIRVLKCIMSQKKVFYQRKKSSQDPERPKEPGMGLARRT